jgi:hypothetical protein
MDKDELIKGIVKPLGRWSEPAPPGEGCPYDHCRTAGDPFYRVEWKSWKDHDWYSVALHQRDTEVYITSEPTLATAKAAAEADYRASIASALDLDKLEALAARLAEVEAGIAYTRHTDTMNDIVLLGLARDEAILRAETAEAERDHLTKELDQARGLLRRSYDVLDRAPPHKRQTNLMSDIGRYLFK